MSDSISTKLALKHPRSDGTASSIHTIDSEGEADVVIRQSALGSKRVKPTSAQQPSSERDNGDSSDDEPLINRLMARSYAKKGLKWLNATNPSNQICRVRQASDCVPTEAPSAVSTALAQEHHNRLEVFDGYNSTLRKYSTPSPSNRSVYGERSNLIPAFKSAAAYPGSAIISGTISTTTDLHPHSRRANALASSFTPSTHQRVPTPDRVFTNMRLSEVNKLIMSMPAFEAETRCKASKNDWKKAKRGLMQNENAVKECFGEDDEDEADSDMAKDRDLGLVNADVGSEDVDYDETNENPRSVKLHYGSGNKHAGCEREGPLTECSGYELAVSQSAVEEMSLEDKCKVNHFVSDIHPSRSTALNQAPASVLSQLRTGRAADSSPATISVDTSNVIDLTEDDDTDPPKPEVSKVNFERETAFLSTFNSRWWVSGYTIRTAIIEINASLGPSIMRFSQEEGTTHLRSLNAQGKLAIRHELVYHLDQDPGPDALATPVKGNFSMTTQNQHFVKDFEGQELETVPESLF
ncbi:hypothetical protein SVAN01_01505 [Stagonosporopsis vannaccii]|nr:hypothetical protein SVAN01_01505 [Stagonosporopsis vannaccii]